MVTRIKSIEKTLQIIEFLGQNPNSSLTEICRHTGLNKSTAYRLLATLEYNNYIFQSQDNNKYRLTVKFAYLGHQVLDHDLIGRLRPALTKLKQEIGETVNLMIRENDNMVFQDKLESQNAPFRTKAYIGMYSEMYCTAGGKSMLAFSSKQDQEQYWQRNNLNMQQYTAATITKKNDFFAELELIKQQGYAIDNEENETGISCVAVCMLDNSGLPLCSVSISTLTQRLNNLGTQHVATMIKNALASVKL